MICDCGCHSDICKLEVAGEEAGHLWILRHGGGFGVDARIGCLWPMP